MAPRSPRVLDNSLSRHRTNDGPCLLQDGHGPSAAPAVQARQLDAAVLSAAERINRVELIRCFQALLAPLSYDFPATGILTDASKLSAVHDLISSYWSSSSDWQTFKATDAYRRAAPAFERFATLGGRFLPPLIPVGVVNGVGSSSDPTSPEWMSAFFEPPAAPAPPPPPPPIPSGAAAPAPPPGAAAPAPPGAAAPAAPPSGAAASAVDSSRLPRLSKDHPQVKLPPGLPQDPESISTRLVHAYIVFAAFSDDDIKKAWAALREQQPVAFPPFFLAASHPKRTPWALASFNRAPSPPQFIPAAGPYHSFQTPHAGYLPHPPLLLGGPGGPPPRQMMQNICFRCGDHGHKSNSGNKPQTTNPERLAGIAAARQRVAAHAAKRKATPTSDPRAKRNRT